MYYQFSSFPFGNKFINQEHMYLFFENTRYSFSIDEVSTEPITEMSPILDYIRTNLVVLKNNP